MRMVKWVVVVLALGVTAGSELSGAAAGGGQSEFTRTREGHKTKLREPGPSPQAADPTRLPAGVKEIVYKSGELKLKGWVTDDPGDGKKHPAVVYVHGGFAFGQEDYDETATYRDAGFVVMTPMLRGENDNPGNWEWFYGEVDDVVAAGRYVASLAYVDAKHVFVAGHSSGAAETILATLVTPNPFAAAAPIGGYVNMSVFVTKPQWRNALPFDPDHAEEVKLRSADQFVSSVQCPITFYVGKRDASARIGLDAFLERAKKLGKSCEKVDLEGDHHTSKPEALQRSAERFKKLASRD
jgi:dipeptidyl aminopeptidase/acylaminoacyl peptidase